MTYIPDLSHETYVPVPNDGYQYVSVGWLGDVVIRPRAPEPSIIRELRRAATRRLPAAFVTAGLHRCEICGDHADRGEFFIEHGPVRYLLPNMVFHYMEVHHYPLPRVVAAALRGKDTVADVIASCPRCDAAIREAQLLRLDPHLDVYRCRCGYELEVPRAEPVPLADVAARLVLDAVWSKEHASARELKVLRQLFPTYRQRPVVELRASLGRGPVPVGADWRGPALDLVRRARDAGLDLRTRPMTD